MNDKKNKNIAEKENVAPNTVRTFSLDTTNVNNFQELKNLIASHGFVPVIYQPADGGPGKKYYSDGEANGKFVLWSNIKNKNHDEE